MYVYIYNIRSIWRQFFSLPICGSWPVFSIILHVGQPRICVFLCIGRKRNNTNLKNNNQLSFSANDYYLLVNSVYRVYVQILVLTFFADCSSRASYGQTDFRETKKKKCGTRRKFLFTRSNTMVKFSKILPHNYNIILAEIF